MRFQVTVERFRSSRRRQKATWQVVGSKTFDDLDQADTWLKGQGFPMEPTPGWAVRLAVHG